jgi:hypothetical protein
MKALQVFDLKAMQKKGSMDVNHSVEYIVGTLIVILLIAVLAGTIFGYLGTGTYGLGNTTANPAVPTWLPSVLIVAVGVGLLYLVFRALGLVK